MPSSIEGPRLIRQEEFQESMDLVNRCFGFKRGGLEARMPHCFDESHPERHAIIKRDGAVVSHAVCVPAELRAGDARIDCHGIAGVATDPDHRGNGHMTQLLEFWLEQLDDRDIPLAELEGDRVRYGRFGWENAGREREYQITRRSFGGEQTHSEHGRSYWGATDIPLIRSLHESEQFRVQRDRRRYECLLDQTDLETLIYEGDRPAYLCYRGEGPTSVLEFGGSRVGVATLLDSVLETSGDVHLYTHPRHPLVSLFREVAGDWKLRPHRKLNVLDVATTLDSYRPLLEDRWSSVCSALTGGSGAVSIGIAGDRGYTDSGQAALVRYEDDGTVTVERTDTDPDVTAGRRKITRLLFGTADDCQCIKRAHQFLAAVLPLGYYFWQTETI